MNNSGAVTLGGIAGKVAMLEIECTNGAGAPIHSSPSAGCVTASRGLLSSRRG